MKYQYLKVEKKDHVALVTLNRPETLRYMPGQTDG